MTDTMPDAGITAGQVLERRILGGYYHDCPTCQRPKWCSDPACGGNAVYECLDCFENREFQRDKADGKLADYCKGEH